MRDGVVSGIAGIGGVVEIRVERPAMGQARRQKLDRDRRAIGLAEPVFAAGIFTMVCAFNGAPEGASEAIRQVLLRRAGGLISHGLAMGYTKLLSARGAGAEDQSRDDAVRVQ